MRCLQWGRSCHFLKRPKTDISETWSFLANPSHILGSHNCSADVFLRALKEVTNGWRGIGPYLAEKRRTIHNRRPANGRTLTGHDEIVEKDRGLKSFDHRRSNGRSDGGIRGRAQREKELETKIIRFPKR